MPHRTRAIVLRPRDPPSPRVLTAELRLAGLLREVDALEDEVETLAQELAAFEARYLDATGQAFAELDRAEGLLRRVRRVADEVARLLDALERGRPATAARDRRSAASRGHAAGAGPAPRERAAAAAPPRPATAGRGVDGDEALQLREARLKALHRRLARRFHPDLARGDAAERARRSDVMARANDAYERDDLAALELLAERAGAFECEPSLSEAERLVHLARRIAAIESARSGLVARRARLHASGTGRLRAEAPRRAERGGDLLAEARAAAEVEARAARERAMEILGRLSKEARSLARARRDLLSSHVGRGAKRSRRTWDPVAESSFLREPGARRRGRHSSPASRLLAVALENQAKGACPWEAALTLLAFLGEGARRPPEPLASWGELAERWDGLRAAWPGAPDLGRALCLMPRHLEIGLRLRGDEVEVGLQLASPELADGVRAALEKEAPRELAQRVLAALGPRERCGCAGEVYGVHLVRVRGVDEVHGLACPRCAAVLKSFRRYGEPEGLEALSPLSVKVGLVAEQPLRLAGAALVFQMLPAERSRLTARALLRRFRELCLEPHGVELPRGALGIRARRALVAPGARVPEGVSVALVTMPGAGLDEHELLDLLRVKAMARFRS